MNSSSGASVRRVVSVAQRARNRANRRSGLNADRGAGAGALGGQSGLRGENFKNPVRRNYFLYGLLSFVTGTSVYCVVGGDDNYVSLLFKSTPLYGLYSSYASTFTLPHRRELLPDWPMHNVPKDIPCPCTLVVDLEDTVVRGVWEKRYGWRYAKRPGVDKFLSTLSQYYEIVLMSPSLASTAEPVCMSLDKAGNILHYVFREGLRYEDGRYIKDLSYLNRPIRRIICIDDDEGAVSHRGNLIKVKPFTDVNNKSDDELERLIPLLVEIAKSNPKDIPKLLSQFNTVNGHEIATEYERRVREAKVEYDNRTGLLGTFAGKMKPDFEPEFGHGSQTMSREKGLTSRQLIGSSPSSEDPAGSASVADGGDEGGVIGWWKGRQKEKEEVDRVKMQHWGEVMERKRREQESAAAGK